MDEIKLSTFDQALAWGDAWKEEAVRYKRMYEAEHALAVTALDGMHKALELAAALAVLEKHLTRSKN